MQTTVAPTPHPNPDVHVRKIKFGVSASTLDDLDRRRGSVPRAAYMRLLIERDCQQGSSLTPR